MSEFLIELGEKVKSEVNGFKGMITSRAEHRNGCNRYWVEPLVDKNGKTVDGQWIDEIELLKSIKSKKKVKKPGGFPSRIK